MRLLKSRLPLCTIQASQIDVIVVYNHSSAAATLERNRENPMWYGNTKSLLESIVRRLKTVSFRQSCVGLSRGVNRRAADGPWAISLRNR